MQVLPFVLTPTKTIFHSDSRFAEKGVTQPPPVMRPQLSRGLVGVEKVGAGRESQLLLNGLQLPGPGFFQCTLPLLA